MNRGIDGQIVGWMGGWIYREGINMDVKRIN